MTYIQTTNLNRSGNLQFDMSRLTVVQVTTVYQYSVSSFQLVLCHSEIIKESLLIPLVVLDHHRTDHRSCDHTFYFTRKLTTVSNSSDMEWHWQGRMWKIGPRRMWNLTWCVLWCQCEMKNVPLTKRKWEISKIEFSKSRSRMENVEYPSSILRVESRNTPTWLGIDGTEKRIDFRSCFRRRDWRRSSYLDLLHEHPSISFLRTVRTLVYYEEIKREEVNRILIYECRCDERLRGKAEGSTQLTYTRLCGEWNT
jgi:hypothetical protein